VVKANTEPRQQTTWITVRVEGGPTHNIAIVQAAAPSISLSLNANGGTVSSSSVPVTIGVPIGQQSVTLPTPTRAGYSFAGWYRTSTGFALPVNANTAFYNPTTLYARWNVNITLNPAGGSISQQINNRVSGMLWDLPEPTRAGRTFEGWFTTPLIGGTQFTTNEIPNSHTTLYARWAFTWNSDDHTVSYWPDRIIVGRPEGTVPSDAPYNYNTVLNTAVASWSSALGGVSIERGGNGAANVKVYIGDPIQMRAASGSIGFFSGYAPSRYANYGDGIDIFGDRTKWALPMHGYIEVYITTGKIADSAGNIERLWNSDEILYLTLHELGHALGYEGHSQRLGDVMYGEKDGPGVMQDPPITALSQREKEHLRQIYDAFRTR